MAEKCQNERKKNENSSETKRIHQKVPYEQIQDILHVKGWLHKITYWMEMSVN